MKYLLLLIPFIIDTSLLAKVNIIQLPQESNVVNLDEQEDILTELDKLFEGRLYRFPSNRI